MKNWNQVGHPLISTFVGRCSTRRGLSARLLLGFFPSPPSSSLFTGGGWLARTTGGPGHELDQRDRRRVSAALTDFDNSRIAAGTVFEAGRDRVKQFSHDRLIL